MPISNTTAKDFENLISYLNSCWNVLSDWYGQFFYYLHSFTLKNGCKGGQYKGPKRPQNRVFVLLCKIVISFCYKWSKMMRFMFGYLSVSKSHIWENSSSRDLGQKVPKVGRAVGKNQLFCILFKIGSLYFFHILHKVRGH